MLSTFTFDNKELTDFGLIVKDKSIRKSPARNIRAVSVPGRSGDVLIDEGNYSNMPINYTVRAFDFKAVDYTGVARWLGSAGYKKLIDSDDSSHFRMARCTSGQDWKDLDDNLGDMSIDFDCEPFRYLLSGETPVEIKSKNTRITNPTKFTSYPYMKIEGSGAVTLYIGDNSYYIKSIDGYIELDCKALRAYKGTSTRAYAADFDEFPTLRPDWNGISWAGNVTKITIIPHWREL